jgi:hypothetical protein
LFHARIRSFEYGRGTNVRPTMSILRA